MIKVAIVEDEEMNQEILKSYLLKYAEEHNEVFTIDVYGDGLAFLEKCKLYDLVFFDIALPNINGMETAQRLRRTDENVSIIFVTNLVNFAIKGYEVNALDYILKPVKYIDFSCRLDKFIKKFNANKQSEIVLGGSGSTVVRVNINDIKYIEVAGSHNICYHMANQKDIFVRESLTKAEKQLPQGIFSKCNSGCLVNLNYANKIDNKMVKVGSDWLVISRAREKEFKNALLSFLND